MSTILKPVPMARIAVVGLKKYRQEVISILHDLKVVQLEPLSKETSSLVRTERESELHSRISDQLLRIKGLRSVLPVVPVTSKFHFSSLDELLDKVKSINIDERVGTLQRQKENLLTKLKEVENNIGLVTEFSFFDEDLNVLQLMSARSFFARVKTQEYDAFRKALESNSQDIVMYADKGSTDKGSKVESITHLILVVSPRFPSSALATAVQAHNVHLEPVPKLNGKPATLAKDLQNTRSE